MNIYRYNQGRIVEIPTIPPWTDSNITIGLDVVFHPQKPLIAHLALSTCVAVWDVGRSAPHTTLNSGKVSDKQQPLTCLSCSAQVVIAGRSDGWVLFWPWEDSSSPTTRRRAHSSCVISVSASFSSERGVCVFSASAETIVKHNLTTGVASDEIRIFSPPELALRTSIFAAASSMIYAVGRGVEVATVNDGTVEIKRVGSVVRCLAVCSKFARFVAGLENGFVVFGDERRSMTDPMSSESALLQLQLHRHSVACVGCTPSRVLSCSDDCSVLITTWEGLVVGQLSPTQTTSVRCIAVNDRYGFIVTGMSDAAVKVWRPEGALATSHRGHTGRVSRVAVHPLGGLVASVGDDLSVRVFTIPRTAELSHQVNEQDEKGDNATRQEGSQTHVVGKRGGDSPSSSHEQRWQSELAFQLGRSSSLGSAITPDRRVASLYSPPNRSPIPFQASAAENLSHESSQGLLIDVTTEPLDTLCPDQHQIFGIGSQSIAPIVQAICQSAGSYSKFSDGVVYYVTTVSKNLHAQLLHSLDRSSKEKLFSLENFLRQVDFSEWITGAPRGSRHVTPAALRSAVVAVANAGCSVALSLLTVPSPLQTGIRNFLLIFASHQSSPMLSQQTQTLGALLLEVHCEISRLPKYTEDIVFRWCRATVSPPSVGSEIVFPSIPYCVSSAAAVDAALRNESGDLCGTIVVIQTGHWAHSFELAAESTLMNIMIGGEDEAIVFSPFQRFYVGDSRIAHETYCHMAERVKVPISSLQNVSFWMLYEVAN